MSSLNEKLVTYVNHPTDKVRIHREGCKHYQNRKANKTKNGFWGDVNEYERYRNLGYDVGICNCIKNK